MFTIFLIIVSHRISSYPSTVGKYPIRVFSPYLVSPGAPDLDATISTTYSEVVRNEKIRDIEIENEQLKEDIYELRKYIAVLKKKLDSLSVSDASYSMVNNEINGIVNIQIPANLNLMAANSYRLLYLEQGMIQPRSMTIVKSKSPTPVYRRRRWEALNQCLDASKYSREQKNGELSTAYSSVRYDDVKDVFEPITEDYSQAVRAIPHDDFELLTQYLDRTSTIIGKLNIGKEAKRLYFIAPILVIVCSLFKGDIQIKVEEDLIGKNVRANGHFEFILQRGKKRICIVEAKKENMEQGIAQCLVGCEVASDVGNLNVVYGIVTTFVSWTFLKSFDDRIEQEDVVLNVRAHGVDRESLREVAGKIYSMLSDE